MQKFSFAWSIRPFGCLLLGLLLVSACFPPEPKIECLPCPCPTVGFQCENNRCVKTENLGKTVCQDEPSPEETPKLSEEIAAEPPFEEKTDGGGEEKTPDPTCTSTNADCTIQNKLGECAKGKLQCKEGSLTCLSDYSPIDEVCNGKDDDCNGTIDENIPFLGADCVVEEKQGECVKGKQACNAGKFVCEQFQQPTKPVCNGKDNDCDGLIDCWPVSFGGAKEDIAKAIVLDKNGNIYIAGTFEETPTFGTTNLTSKGQKDIFVAKLDPEGKIIWVMTAGGSGDDLVNALAIDSQGDLYITGSFQGSATFGKTTLTSKNGSEDLFVAKVSDSGTTPSQGNILWAVSFGDIEQDMGMGLTLDQQNNLYVTGKFTGAVTFGTKTLTTKGQGSDIFVAKLDISTGTPTLAISLGGETEDEGRSIACDTKGELYVAGTFSGNASFGDLKVSTNGKSDGFVTKLDTSGKVLWVSPLGGSLDDVVGSLAVDGSGNAYITGTFQTEPLAEATFGTIKLTSKGSEDGFVAKLDPSGKFLWATPFGGKGEDAGHFISLDAEENPIVTGFFDGAVKFGSITPPAEGNFDVFVAKLNPYGHFLGVQSWGGPTREKGHGLAVDKTGNSYVVGDFTGNSSGAIPLTSRGEEDIFLLKVPELCGLGCVETLNASSGTEDKDGPLRQTKIFMPIQIAFDSNGDAFILQGHRIRKWDKKTNLVTTLSEWPQSLQARAMVIDPSGNFYITESLKRILKVDTQGKISVFAGPESASNDEPKDGFGPNARFYHLEGITMDRSGNLYVLDGVSGAIRKIDPQRNVTTLIKQKGIGGFRDGSFDEALFRTPSALALDAQEKNIYILEFGGCRLRKANLASRTISTIVGAASDSNTNGYRDGQGTDARFRGPSSFVIDANGMIYIADSGNHRIRMVDPLGNVSTFAGSTPVIPPGPGGYKDGPRKEAEFELDSNTSLAIDPTRRYLYIVESNRSRIRRIQIKP